MAVVARNDSEREFCRLYISGLLQKGGRKTGAVEVWRLLNRRLRKNAREAAEQAGWPQEDVAEAEAEAGVSLRTVREDLRTILGNVQEATLAGSAVFLDDQLAAVRDDIEDTYAIGEQIREDLARARVAARSKGVQAKRIVEGKEVVSIEPTEIIREPAAAAALYGRLIETFKLRSDLRAEERKLKFGRMHVPDEDDEEQRTMAQIVSDIGDPETARQACLSLLRREMKNLAVASRTPLAGDMVQMDLARVRRMEAEIRTFREYVRLPDDQIGDGKVKHKTFEVVFDRYETRQIQEESDG